MQRMPESEAPTRIGFIGAGGIARRHVGTLRTVSDVEIVGIADPDADRARALAAEVGARAYVSHVDMLDREALDAAYICVPPFAHGPPERAVIDAGLPFFVEKPLSLSIGDAEAIALALEQCDLVTAVGYHWRYMDTVDEARRLLRDTPARLVSGYWLDQTPPPNWWWHEAQSGGQIVEQATHVVDLARYLVGEITEVYAAASRAEMREGFPGLDVATGTGVSLKFAGGAVGTLAATCLLRWSHRIGLHLFGDGLAIELSEREIMVDVGRGRPVRQSLEDPVALEDRDFIDAVRGIPSRIRCPYREALKSHRVALAIARSARTGSPVRIALDGESSNA
jgi:predicted dehydrogenase